jgi:uncharacterized protein YjaZ
MGKTSSESKNKYAKKAYDDIRLQVKKGKKDLVKEYAEKQGLSLQGFIKLLIKKETDIDV